MTPVQFLEDPN